MADKEVVEVIFGKHSKFEIVKDSPVFGSPKFYVRKNGRPFKGSFSTLRAAVEAAKTAG